MINEPSARVVLQPQVTAGLQRGCALIVKAIRPTLGPRPHQVVYDRVGLNKPPEFLDDGGLIARHIIGLTDRDADVGAMLLRHMLWRVHQEAGDGVATATVIFEAVYRQCLRLLAAGGNAMTLRRYLEFGLSKILLALDGMAQPVAETTSVAQVAESICHDPELAQSLAGIFETIGVWGHFETRSGRGRHLECEFIQGTYWPSEMLSKLFMTDVAGQRGELITPHILLTDLEIEDPQEIIPVFSVLKKAGAQSLLLVANKLTEKVTALLMAARQNNVYQVLAAKTPGQSVEDQAQALEDLSVLTGARPLIKVAGDRLAQVRYEDLGRARKAWTDRYYLGIIGGQGDGRLRRIQLGHLKAAFDLAKNADGLDRLQTRIGKLIGGAAILWIGAATEPEMESRKAAADRSADVLRGAMRGGVVPGGGIALLNCRDALQALSSETAIEARVACRALQAALEAPFRAIVENAGYPASVYLEQLGRLSENHGFDARCGRIVDMSEAGIWDSVAVLRRAVYTAISTAALALTIEVIVHHKNPEESLQP